ncbi:hypothetical protein ARMSODRAFT_1018739 [Armillaria solidipes]|uniref:Uncharacterized protein n=1 Tax=Armillaria solidipes TaxID=1076256 RepID=A0A2H3C1Y6_9AGAR|nr:hypothetical protein ARMSODRAFT_1018739 [Armillaria solidipes]
MVRNSNRGNLGKRDSSPGDLNPVKPKHGRVEPLRDSSPLSTTSTLNTGSTSSTEAKPTTPQASAQKITEEDGGDGRDKNEDNDNKITPETAKSQLEQKETTSAQDANPYQLIVSGLTTLPRVKDYLKSRYVPDRVPTVNIAVLYRGNRPLVKRLMGIAFAPSKDYLMNTALIDPGDFSVNRDQVVRSSLMPQSFFIIGSVVYSDLFGLNTSKQICVQPLDFMWPRIAAAVGKIFDVAPNKALMNNGYKGGLSFSSWLKSGDNSKASDTERKIPINGKRHGPAICSRDEPVPVFDCRGSFKLSSYHVKPQNKVDPENGSIVLIIFTIGRYKEISYSVASYNVQVVLRLTDPPTESDGQRPVNPLPSYLHDLKPIGVSGSDDGEDLFAVNDNTEDDPAENVY